ncbi:MAG TPA: cobaltochelatase subunit CobN [Mycobacteriales bacterium]|nr:cobaltochelatase subunit CobN [Mycobacteriales bacterium]
MPQRIVVLSTADTELLAARAAVAELPAGFPEVVTANPASAGAVDLSGARLVVVRLLGGRSAWPEGFEALRTDCADAAVPLVALGGEAAPDADMTAASTVPAGVVQAAHAYFAEGGVANTAQALRFLADTVLLEGFGFEPAVPLPGHGVRGSRGSDPARPTVGVVFYRAHELSGNAGFVDVLCDAIEARGANALPVFCYSMRPDASGVVPVVDELLRGRIDAVVTTVLASGGSNAGDAEGWDARALATLDVPILQGLCLTSSRAAWAESSGALAPIDAAMQVAIPEFDGRLVTVPFSFKEPGPDGIAVYVADVERAGRLADIAVRHARLRHVRPAQKRVAIVLSSYPTKHARVGNAVGLDTPASAVVLLRALRDAGYDVGAGELGALLSGDGPVTAVEGDALIHALIAAGGHDVEWLTEEQLAGAAARAHGPAYAEWFGALPEELRSSVVQHWGEPPGSLYVDGGDIVLATLRFGNVLLMIQPPRGFGENPIAIYHDPDLPPSHHYLAAYRWLDLGWGADAVIHLGKHGTLEWLPGKGLGLSAECAPDAVLGGLPLFYPFIVNDPGEGTQAKRRAHATIVDHLIPPMARADTYNELARLEQLLDEYATVAALDPSKLPTIRAQIWELVQEAKLHHDLHVSEAPDADEFDEFLLHVDGYLCEIKDVQIRDGLHVLGGVPAGEARVDLVLAILRAVQTWGGAGGAIPGLRRALCGHFGLDEKLLLAEPGAVLATGGSGASPGLAALTAVADGPARTASDVVDLVESLARSLVGAMDAAGWDPLKAPVLVQELLRADVPDVVRVLEFACTEVVPRLDRTTDEISHLLGGLDGRFVPAGPSGSPTRGLVGVLPTGRNFYSVDPKAIPSRLAWDVGVSLADSLITRYVADSSTYPESVGLVVWGTSAMRTQGDDIAEVLALLGCRPEWDDASRRVTGFAVTPLEELSRPRIDVTLRISGFFRDAFPHVIALLDDAIRTVALLDEPDDDNYVAKHARLDLAAHGDERRATTRIFGSKPGAYGAGLLPLIDSGNWRTDADLAEVYTVWGGYAYGRGLDGAPARDDMETVYRRIRVAAKNQDTREHDIVDSDDYFQYHGGMVAAVRALTGTDPSAYIGDSAVTDAVRTRTLAEETRRVFRARVVNPKWVAAMMRHGYKGAFELAATVDYLFGYDATAGVVDDWMYQQLADSYVFDPGVREFMKQSNPWALRGIAERLLEAAQRSLWASPDPATIEALRATYLELEGDLEGAGQPAPQ